MEMSEDSSSPADIVAKCQEVFAHAWMVRTFIKHSEEVEDFPELMTIVRAVFDTCRAVGPRVDDPPAYLKMLSKKIGRLRRAAAQFREDAPLASTHTNFKMAVESIDVCVRELGQLLEGGLAVSTPRQTKHPED